MPGSRPTWIALFALVPWLNAGANLLLDSGARSAAWDQSPTLVLLNYAALSSAVVITVWGADRIARRSEDVPGTAATFLEVDATDVFRGMNAVVAPLAASVITAIAFALALVDAGWVPAVLRGATWLVIGIPIWTFLWTYAALQLGLDRLGREQLRPDPGRADPTLGLRPIGQLAFLGLWLLLAWLVPVLLTGLPDIVGVTIGAAVLAGALAAFFLSLLRVHRQMAAVKASELASARAFYAEAYEPVRITRTLETLERQQPLLGAADALEKRASAIHEWPVDEATVTRVVTVTTSVIAITIGRLILDPLGL